MTAVAQQARPVGRSELQLPEEPAALLDFQRDIHPGVALGQKITAPGRECVGPSLDGVDVTTDLGRREARRPAIVLLQRHGNAEPFVGAFAPPEQLGGEHGISIANDIGPDVYLLADHALDRETACIDDWINVLDVDALTGEVDDGPDAHVRCHGLIVLCRSAGPPGRQKDMMVMEPIRPRFGSGGCAAVSGPEMTKTAQLQPFDGTNPDLPWLSVDSRRKFLARRQVGSVDLERPGYGRNS